MIDRAKANATRLITGYKADSIKTWFSEKYTTDADMGPQVYTRFERLVATHTSHVLITSYAVLQALYDNRGMCPMQESPLGVTCVDGQRRIIVIDGMTQVTKNAQPGLVCGTPKQPQSTNTRNVQKIENILKYLLTVEPNPIAIVSLCCDSFKVAQNHKLCIP